MNFTERNRCHNTKLPLCHCRQRNVHCCSLVLIYWMFHSSMFYVTRATRRESAGRCCSTETMFLNSCSLNTEQRSAVSVDGSLDLWKSHLILWSPAVCPSLLSSRKRSGTVAALCGGCLFDPQRPQMYCVIYSIMLTAVRSWFNLPAAVALISARVHLFH